MPYAQAGEDVFIDEFFNTHGTTNTICVDIGAGDGVGLSNTRHLLDKGWKGIRIDGCNHGNPAVHQHWVTKDNILELLETYECPTVPDFCSLDLDGNDYWIVKQILTLHKPRLFCVEYNPAFPKMGKFTIPYNENHTWDGTTYYGASALAFRQIFCESDYRPIWCNGINIMFTSLIVPEDISGIRYGHSHPLDPQNRPLQEVL